MNKDISSMPEAAKFRSISTLIIVLVCIFSFLIYTEHLSEKAENIAEARVISSINYSLAMMLYDYTIKGRQLDLKSFDLGNPFLAVKVYRSLPNNYQGEIDRLGTDPEDGWYYLISDKKTIYISRKGVRRDYFMKYEDGNSSDPGRLFFYPLKSKF